MGEDAISLEPFGTLSVFAMWQNRSDRFCHFASTTFTLCFDQGQVLLLHAPRYMGLNGHVPLAQADMSPWSKRTCLFGANGHVPLDTSTLKGINFGLLARFMVSLAGLTTASRYITAEGITPKLRFYENPPCAVEWILAFQRCSADWATDPRNIKIT